MPHRMSFFKFLQNLGYNFLKYPQLIYRGYMYIYIYIYIYVCMYLWVCGLGNIYGQNEIHEMIFYISFLKLHKL